MATATLGPAATSLSPRDLALGFPYGSAEPLPRVAAISRPGPTRTGASSSGEPLAILEQIVGESLLRGPCFVSFSGGVDSSLILAVATRLARRLGTPDPIPLTWRFDASAPSAREDAWQEAVVAELGLADWQRLDAADQLDWLGPVASRVLSEHGLLYPANAFLHAPLAELAIGGTLLTGIGGDQVLGLWRHREVAALLARRRAPRRSDLRHLAPMALPRRLRAQVGRWLAPIEPLGWLTPAGRRLARDLDAAERYAEPVFWNARLAWRWARRDTQLSLASLEAIGVRESQVAAPLLDRRFVAALATAGGLLGVGTRAETVEHFFGPVLPQSVRHRRDKARFGQVFWREQSRAYARRLASTGHIAELPLVDGPGLRREWAEEQPDHRTALLLQHQWLTDSPGSVKISGGPEPDGPNAGLSQGEARAGR